MENFSENYKEVITIVNDFISDITYELAQSNDTITVSEFDVKRLKKAKELLRTFHDFYIHLVPTQPNPSNGTIVNLQLPPTYLDNLATKDDLAELFMKRQGKV